MWTASKNVKYGVAIYNFDGKVKYGLPLEIGETVQLLEECAGWYRGFSTRNKAVKGIFPATYIHPKPVEECVVDNEGPYETVTPLEDTTVREVGYVLKEWNGIWKNQFKEKKTSLFKSVKTVTQSLLSLRRQLLSGKTTEEQKRTIKAQIVSKIDCINGQLGLDLVPRIDNEQVDPDKISIIDLYRLHKQGVENSRTVSVSQRARDLQLAELLNKIPMAYEGKKNSTTDEPDIESMKLSRKGTVRAPPPTQLLRLHHIVLEIRKFACLLGEVSEIVCGVLDFKDGQYVSEKFLARLTRNGLPESVDKINHNAAIFTDFGNDDLVKDLYMVAYVYRKGSMLQGDHSSISKKVPTQQYRRPYGCSVLSIREVLLNQIGHNDDKEFHMKVYCCNESDFPSLHENIIKKLSSKYSLSSSQNNYGMVVSLRMLHGDLTSVKRENPLLFTKPIAVCRRLGFSDVIRPGDVRNDLYLTLCSGEFERGKKKVGKNVEVKLVVLDESGKVIPNAISVGAGEDNVSEFHSVVFYHNNLPKWGQTVKLNVPLEKFPTAHFRLEFRHASTNVGSKLWGFAFAKLVNENGATMRDGKHELFLYKCEDVSKLQWKNYGRLLSSYEDGGTHSEGSLFQRSQRETVFIDTLLCSTKFTQNVDLLSFLKWRSEPENLKRHLDKLMKLDGEEIVKFLHDILDALFSMFALENPADTVLVFKALVYICQILKDDKFENFQAVMDNYISDEFSAPLVFRHLLRCLILEVSSSSADGGRSVSKMFKALEYIFKFLVQSKKLFTRSSGDMEEPDDFMLLLDRFINTCCEMLQSGADVIDKAQAAFLQNLSSTFPELLRVISCQDVAEMICRVMSNMHSEHPLSVKEVKLQCLRDAVNSKVFEDAESRDLILQVCMTQLKRHLVTKQCSVLATNILGDILNFLHGQEKCEAVHKDINTVVGSLLDVVAQCISWREREEKGLLVACLINMFKLMDEEHYQAMFDLQKSKEPLTNYMKTVFKVFCDLLQTGVFAKDWMIMKMVTNGVILSTMQFFGQALTDKFLGDDFNLGLWTDYFCLAVAFVTQACLQLEKFTKAKKEKIIEKYGDMRVPMGVDIQSMWQSLGEHKIKFIPSMVGPFLEVTIVPETELRKATLPIFFDMMECEQKANGNFKMVETELIDKLDRLVGLNKGDDQYRELFQKMLQDKIDMEPEWRESGSAFIKSVTRLLERLLDYRRVMSGDSNYSQKMICTVNLLNFYKTEINREEMYIRYIYKLRDLHLRGDNFTEAAFTLKLHADMLDWSDDMIESDLSFPQQMKWQRKEAIYKQIIHYFDKGKSWEYCLPLCKELANLYEKMFNYAELSNILKTQATFLDNILSTPRFETCYFRLGFFGQSFPTFLRNKTFICHGQTLEHIGEFKKRVLADHPNAQLLNFTSQPDPSILTGETAYVQLCAVKPIPQERPEFKGQNVPARIIEYYKVNDVDLFQFDRPFHEGKKDDKIEFKTLCLERTRLRIGNKLPGVLKYFEVVESKTVILKPIETAIDSMENMNRELQSLIAVYQRGNETNINPLTMRLNGVIDAAVQGGPKLYKEAFFTQDFAIEHPEHADNIFKLKGLLAEQIHILEGGLKLHTELAPPEVKPLHEKMVLCFKELKREMSWSDAYSDTSSQKSDSDPFETSRPASTTSTTSRPSYSSGISDSTSGTQGVETSGVDDDENIYACPDVVTYRKAEWRKQSLQVGGKYSELPGQQKELQLDEFTSSRGSERTLSPSSDSGTSCHSASPRETRTSLPDSSVNIPPLPPRKPASPKTDRSHSTFPKVKTFSNSEIAPPIPEKRRESMFHTTSSEINRIPPEIPPKIPNRAASMMLPRSHSPHISPRRPSAPDTNTVHQARAPVIKDVDEDEADAGDLSE